MSNLFTTKGAAEKLAVDEQTVRRWLREKKLEGTKIGAGRIYRISQEQIDAFIHKCSEENK